jgi:hypothetical protein
MHRTLVLSVAFYGCEAWSVDIYGTTQIEGTEDIFGPKCLKLEKICIIKCSIICTAHFIRMVKSRRMRCMRNAMHVG